MPTGGGASAWLAVVATGSGLDEVGDCVATGVNGRGALSCEGGSAAGGRAGCALCASVFTTLFALPDAEEASPPEVDVAPLLLLPLVWAGLAGLRAGS